MNWILQANEFGLKCISHKCKNEIVSTLFIRHTGEYSKGRDTMVRLTGAASECPYFC
jgi:hypothetical protein